MRILHSLEFHILVASVFSLGIPPARLVVGFVLNCPFEFRLIPEFQSGSKSTEILGSGSPMIINIVSKDHVYKFVLYTHRQTEVGWETLPSNETIEENQQSVENWRQSNRTKILWYCNYCYQRGETCWGDKQTQSSQLTELTWKINFYSWTTVAANIFGSFHFSNATNGNTLKMIHMIKSLAKE